jgi:hypothetical protein
MGHYGHMKTGNFRQTLTAFDAVHPRRKQRRIVAWLRKILKAQQVDILLNFIGCQMLRECGMFRLACFSLWGNR